MKDFRFWFGVLILIGVVYFVATVAYATDDCRGNQPCNDINIDVSSNVTNDAIANSDAVADATAGSTASNSSRSYGLSLGDVDINQCYRSYQVLAVWQGTQKNKWCMADSLDAKGLHEAAAVLRCSIDGYAKLFGDRDHCLRVSKMASFPPEPVAVTESIDDDDEEHHYQQQLIDEQAEMLADLEAKYENLRIEVDRPRPISTKTVVQQQPYLSDEQKVALRGLKR